MYGNKQKGKNINHPSNTANHIYLFFDPVHLLKNIRNNLLNSKRFNFFFYLLNLINFSILLMYQGENMERHFGQKLRFRVKRSRISYWTVEIFMLNGRDFHEKRLRFSCWTVEIFMTNGPDFHDERSSSPFYFCSWYYSRILGCGFSPIPSLLCFQSFRNLLSSQKLWEKSSKSTLTGILRTWISMTSLETRH